MLNALFKVGSTDVNDSSIRQCHLIENGNFPTKDNETLTSNRLANKGETRDRDKSF
jgi:hypothetical protein